MTSRYVAFSFVAHAAASGDGVMESASGPAVAVAVVTSRDQLTGLVEEAVHGMLPKTKMGHAMYRKLKVYAGPDHPHTAQKPSKLEVA